MISSNPKLPQFGPGDAEDFVARTFWLRFQERFYALWRELTTSIEKLDALGSELTTSIEKLVQGPSTSTDNQVVRFDGTSGKLVQGSNVYVTDDGRLYGTALHNNAGAVTGTTNQYVASGTYTPTYTLSTGLDAISAPVCQWLRVGNVVTVSGIAELNATTANALVQFRATLPIASAFTSTSQLSGVAAEGNVGGGVFRIEADDSADKVFFSGEMSTADTTNISFTFTYLVV